MAYGDARKKKKRDILGTQVDVYNVHSGRLVTMDDDGVSHETGQANQQRAHMLRKLSQRDADGDPMFVLVTPLKQHCLDEDRFAGGGQELNGRVEIDYPSKSADFATLRDKYSANQAAREGHMRDFNERRYGSDKAPGRSKLKAIASPVAVKVEAGKKAAAKKADKAAAGAVKPGPKPKPKADEAAA